MLIWAGIVPNGPAGDYAPTKSQFGSSMCQMGMFTFFTLILTADDSVAVSCLLLSNLDPLGPQVGLTELIGPRWGFLAIKIHRCVKVDQLAQISVLSTQVAQMVQTKPVELRCAECNIDVLLTY